MYPCWSETGPYETARVYGTKAKRIGKQLQLLATELGWTLKDHQWICTLDGWLQPDFVLESPAGCCVLVECKLTWWDCSRQIEKYKKALREMKRPVISVLACRNLTPEAPPPVSNFEDIVDGSTWHVLI